MKKLNLGCGRDIKEGYINLDNVALNGVDVIWDLSSLPIKIFKENEFDEIYAKHVIEHFNNIIPIMNELYRISKNNAIIKIFVPFYNSEHAFRDPTHKSFFNYDTLDYFTKEYYLRYYKEIKCTFKIEKIDIIGFRLVPKSILRKLSKYLPNLVTELRFTLRVIKNN